MKYYYLIPRFIASASCRFSAEIDFSASPIYLASLGASSPWIGRGHGKKRNACETLVFGRWGSKTRRFVHTMRISISTWTNGELAFSTAPASSQKTNSAVQVQAKAAIPANGARMTRQVESNTLKAVDVPPLNCAIWNWNFPLMIPVRKKRRIR